MNQLHVGYMYIKNVIETFCFALMWQWHGQTEYILICVSEQSTIIIHYDPILTLVLRYTFIILNKVCEQE